jgi:beta-galactosidase/beta-glucuronidase
VFLDHKRKKYLIMKRFFIFFSLAAIAVLVLPLGVSAQKWKMADVPLATTWGEKLDPVLPHNEYPRPVMVRPEWQNLNGLWEFQMANPGDPVPFNKKLSSSILVPFPWESALSGVRKQFDSRMAWYRRTFTVTPDWSGKRILLHFGAVDWRSVVYVNGRAVGEHKGGFDPFTYDITDYLNKKGDQELIVWVYDPGNDEAIASGKQNNLRFTDPQRYNYSPSSGIWQTVWLEPVNSDHVTLIRTVPDIDNSSVRVQVETKGATADASVEVSVFESGKQVARGEGKAFADIILSIPDQRLWSPDSPFLYDLEIVLKTEAGVADKTTGYFGMRKISLGEIHGTKVLHLNNEFLFQMGPLDQGFWPDGLHSAPSDEALKWDVENIKAWGFNMVRKHVKIEPQRWYYWCDRIGLLVWQDMPCTHKKRSDEEEVQFESELRAMVRSYWNHPSIVNWVVFNEHWGAYEVERITSNVMALDPSRLVTGNTGIDAGRPNLDYEVGHIKSNHSYRPPNVALVSNRRATVCGEYGAIGYNLEGHVWDTDGPWVHSTYEGIDAATDEYEKFIDMILGFRKKGLSAAVYTQWTDVENEMNGLYTYDRKKIKLHKERVTEANRSTWNKLIPLDTK